MISFYVESRIVFDGQIQNNSFKYFERPFLNAKLNALFSHTITGVDPEGDSLAFQLVAPQAYSKGSTDCNSGSPFLVPNYKYPNDIKINPFSGNITWTPTKTGDYSFAVKVTEYRNKKIVGYTIRDFQISVKDTGSSQVMTIYTDAKIKEFNVIDIIAEKPLEITVKYAGPVAASIKLEGYWESLPNDKVSFVVKDSANYKIGKFTLATDLSLIRDNPYIVTFTGSCTVGGSVPTLKAASSFILNSKPGKVYKVDTTTIVLGTGNEFDKGALVYPNPIEQVFYVNSKTLSKAKVYLYNSQGQLVRSQELSEFEPTKVYRQSLPTGIYIYRIMSKGIFKESGRVVFK